MSRRLWIGFEITVMSTPPILAASSAFSIVVGEVLWRAPMFLWNCVPVKAAMSSGGRTCTWKSIIIRASLSLSNVSCPTSCRPSTSRLGRHSKDVNARHKAGHDAAGKHSHASAGRRDNRLLEEILPLLRLVEHHARVDELQRTLGEG